MAVSKSKKNSTSTDDLDLLKSDVASFASSLGLSSSLPTSGFNDADFRKSGSFRRDKPEKKPKQYPTEQSAKREDSRNKSFKSGEKPKPKPPILSVEGANGGNLGFDKFKNLPKLPLMKARELGVWYADAAELEAKVIGGEKRAEARNLVEWKGFVAKKRELGERLMAQYAKDYETTRGQSGDIKMLFATQRSGTNVDKVSAFSVLVGDNPVANLRSLDSLLGMVTSKVGKRHALTGFETLKELFISSLLPDHKLKSLLQRPLNHLPETKDGYSLLLFWYWEECLKQRYERFVFALEEASRDVLSRLKDKALKIIYTLLTNKSEQERRLLSALVNKLGDPEKKGSTASNAAFQLTRLVSQSEHPNMRAVVIDEVDSFLFRPHLGVRAKYYAVNFLSQIHLSPRGDGPKVAKRLIDVYFALFKVLVAEEGNEVKKDKSGKPLNGKASRSVKHAEEKETPSESHTELNSRLLSAILTGVNRAFPYVSTNEADDIIETQTPMLFQLVHSENFNVGIQALMLLHKITSKNQVASDRFYRALYAKLLLPAAMNSSKAEMFIGLLIRAMKNDLNLKRVAAFAKRVMQVALQQPPQYACACLFLLSEVLKSKPALGKMVRQSESADEEDEHFKDILEENEDEPQSAPSDKEKDTPLVENGGGAISDDVSSEDDDDVPVSSSDDEVSDEADEFLIGEDPKSVKKSKPVSVSNSKESQVASKKSVLPGGYDPRHREPSYCNADRASWWELTALASHLHPSVSNWANRILLGSDIVYSGNPLNDLSLTAFLDKFMEKKPKSSEWHGGSQIEPSKKLEMSKSLIGPEILSLADEDVPPEDLVFHKFYMNKQVSSKKPKKKKKKKSADDEAAEELYGGGNDDESDNEEIDKMLDSANLSAEADGEYDYDDLDRIADEDDDDLVGNISDDEGADMALDTDIAEGLDFDDAGNEIQSDDDDDDIINIGEADDVSNDDDDIINIGEADDDDDDDDDENDDNDNINEQPKRKRKKGKSGASPFASLEDYEHLLDGDVPAETEPAKKKPKKSKPQRKRK